MAMGFEVRDLDLNPDAAAYHLGELGQITSLNLRLFILTGGKITCQVVRS